MGPMYGDDPIAGWVMRWSFPHSRGVIPAGEPGSRRPLHSAARVYLQESEMSCLIAKARRFWASKNGPRTIRSAMRLAPLLMAIVTLSSRSGA
jgi:hypothetical protein